MTLSVLTSLSDSTLSLPSSLVSLLPSVLLSARLLFTAGRGDTTLTLVTRLLWPCSILSRLHRATRKSSPW